MAAGDAPLFRELVQYRLLRTLEESSGSPLWEAVDTRTGRRVAIERLSPPAALPPADGAAWTARVEGEARRVARLAHPNLAAIHEAGTADGSPFLVTDLPSGRTLRQRLRRGPVPPAEAARLLAQTAAALDAVHAEGIAHGGLVPASVGLTVDGQVRLRGFWTGPDAPFEAARAEDLRALGALLAEMLPGRQPPEMQAVLSRAQGKDPAGRYLSAGALAAAVDEAALACAADPAEARRGAFPLRALPRPVLPALAALLLLAVLALALRAHRPATPLPPPLPLPVETALPVPQTPPTPPGPLPEPPGSPFTPAPARPVQLPEAPPATSPPATKPR